VSACRILIAGSDGETLMVAMKSSTMNYLQSWIEELNPLASLPSIAILFLIAIIAGWYVGNLIQWFRR
jgi:hypothetical protein